MTTTSGRVFLSEYIKNRKINHEHYNLLVDKISRKCEFLFMKSNATIEITMAGKYISPRVIVRENGNAPEKCHYFEDAIAEAMEEIGMIPEPAFVSQFGLVIEFED